MTIPFNKPGLTGNELACMQAAMHSGKLSGDGAWSRRCHRFFEKEYGFGKVLLTTSCTDALEMAALLLDIQPGDEVIVPAYTFVSTANAFVLRGAKIVFADSGPDQPNIDATLLHRLVTPRTKAIVVVHYGGMAADMDTVMRVAAEHGLFVVEDAAQAIDGRYKGKPLGSIGHLATFSFHESKNIHCGEGGLLAINDPRFVERAEILWEKGTNRARFFRGELDKYEWVDVGSSFLLSDLNAAFLWAQLEGLPDIQKDRTDSWQRYASALEGCGLGLPQIPLGANPNGHNFYLLCQSAAQRHALGDYLAIKGIEAYSHYLPLHLSPYYKDRHTGGALPNAVRYAEQLIRLPLYYGLTEGEQDYVIQAVHQFVHADSPEALVEAATFVPSFRLK